MDRPVLGGPPRLDVAMPSATAEQQRQIVLKLPAATAPEDLKAAYGRYPTGVTAVCALVDESPNGIVANSFTGVSLEPPLVSVCVQQTSTTWPLLAAQPRLGVSVLGVEQGNACRQIAAKSGDRFAGLRWTTTAAGAVVLPGAAMCLDCSIDQVVRAGDHDLVLLRVHGVEVNPDVRPLVFHASAFHRLEAA